MNRCQCMSIFFCYKAEITKINFVYMYIYINNNNIYIFILDNININEIIYIEVCICVMFLITRNNTLIESRCSCT